MYIMKYLKAAILPLIGIGLSFLFLKPKEIKTESPLALEPLARVQRTEVELKKKPLDSTTWKSVSEGEALYKGDQVQTSADAGAVLEFLDTGSSIELEPDSTIIIEKGENKFSLNVLSGGLFIKKGEKIDLTSKGQKISFKGDVSFSTNEAGKGELKVIRGQAEATMEDGKKFKIAENELASLAQDGVQKQKNIFNITSPEFQSFYYFEKDDVINDQGKTLGNKVIVKWAPINETIRIGLEIGKSPRKLELIKNISVDASKGTLEFPISPGTFYWRLVSLNDKRTSSTQKNVFQFVQYPIPRSPQDGQIVYITDDDIALKLGFSAPVPLDSGEILIAKDKNFKKIIDTIPLTGSSFYQTNKIKEEATYFWKVSGNLEGSSYKVTSNTVSFKTQFITGTLPPLLISPPEGHQILSDTDEPQPVNFQWKAQDTLSKHNYRFTLINLNKKSAKLEKELEQSFLNVKRIPSGTYEWKVELLDKKGEVAGKSQIRKFQITVVPDIAWQTSKKKYLYLNEMPTIPLDWADSTTDYLNYRILISKTDDFRQVITFTTKDSNYKLQPQSTGEQYIKIEAVDKQGRVLARSQSAKFEIEQVPFAAPPIFLPEKATTFKANAQGRITLRFKPQKDTKKIFVELKDEKGNIVGQHTWEEMSGVIESLLPGEYVIHAKSIDKFGRIGQDSEQRKLIVPNMAKLKAPKIKNIQIR